VGRKGGKGRRVDGAGAGDGTGGLVGTGLARQNALSDDETTMAGSGDDSGDDDRRRVGGIGSRQMDESIHSRLGTMSEIEAVPFLENWFRIQQQSQLQHKLAKRKQMREQKVRVCVCVCAFC
jgi:hypothetical protein